MYRLRISRDHPGCSAPRGERSDILVECNILKQPECRVECSEDIWEQEQQGSSVGFSSSFKGALSLGFELLFQ